MFQDEVAKYKDSEHFMEVVPVGLWESFYAARYNRDQLGQIGSALPLRIIRSSGVDAKRDFDVKITDLSTDKHNVKYKHFHNTGDGGITFKVEVIINPNESWGYGSKGQKEFVYHGVRYPARARILVWLNFWFTNMTPLYVVSDAFDVPNGQYILSGTPKRLQNMDHYTKWQLEFTEYHKITTWKWDASQSLSKYTGKTVPATAKNTNLANCDLTNFKYRREFDPNYTTKCNRWLRDKLYQLGFLSYEDYNSGTGQSGWYGPAVLGAIKQFQKKYMAYFPGMVVNGKCDKVTRDALCSF